MSKYREDKAPILSYNRDADGYLTVTAAICRPGVFPYLRADGSRVMEAKLPDDIFNDSVLVGSRNRPVTDEHPPEPVNADNWSLYSRGFSHGDSIIDETEQLMKVTITVTDSKLIERIESGDQKEISIGFTTDVVEESGEYMGERYDCKQTNIRINHIAVTKAGRAGPMVAIRSDSATQNEIEGSAYMVTYKMDGKEYEVPSEIKSKLEALEARTDAAETKVKSYDDLQGRYDAVEAQLNDTAAQLEEAKKQALSPEQVEAAVSERIELVEGAKAIVGDSVDFKGMNARDIKVSVIKSIKGDSFDAADKSDEYVNAFYDASVTSAQNKGFSSTGENQMNTAFNKDSQGSDLQELRNRRSQLGQNKGGKK